MSLLIASKVQLGRLGAGCLENLSEGQHQPRRLGGSLNLKALSFKNPLDIQVAAFIVTSSPEHPYEGGAR